METLSELMYKFYATIIKILREFPCREINKMILKFRLRNKGPIKTSQDTSKKQQTRDEALSCQIISIY